MWIKATITVHDERLEEIQGNLYLLGIDTWEVGNELAGENLPEMLGGGWDYLDEALLMRSGPILISFFLPNNEQSRGALCKLHELYPGRITEGVADPSAWEDEWRKFYHPIEIGSRLAIRPCWEKYHGAAEAVCAIEPGSLFGTGLHQTTQLCAQALERLVGGGEQVLDLGCGSGILSICALLLGAEHAVAMELEERAQEIIAANMELNGLEPDRWELITGDIFGGALDKLPKGVKYDLILANLTSALVIAASPVAGGLLSEGGAFIASGLIDEKIDEVRKKLLDGGWRIEGAAAMDNWHCLVCRQVQS